MCLFLYWLENKLWSLYFEFKHLDVGKINLSQAFSWCAGISRRSSTFLKQRSEWQFFCSDKAACQTVLDGENTSINRQFRDESRNKELKSTVTKEQQSPPPLKIILVWLSVLKAHSTVYSWTKPNTFKSKQNINAVLPCFYLWSCLHLILITCNLLQKPLSLGANVHSYKNLWRI